MGGGGGGGGQSPLIRNYRAVHLGMFQLPIPSTTEGN